MFYHIFFILLLLIALFCTYAIARNDFHRQIIPDIYLFPLLIIGLLITNFFPWPISAQEGVIAAAFGYTISAIIGATFNKIFKNKKEKIDSPIGMGDIKLISVGGIWLGATGLSIALIIACISGFMWGKLKKIRFIPFAPFFIFGSFLSFIAIMFLI